MYIYIVIIIILFFLSQPINLKPQDYPESLTDLIGIIQSDLVTQ